MFKPTVYMARLGLIARLAPRMAKNIKRARHTAFGQTYENVDAIPDDVIEAFVQPVAGTRERAEAFQRWLVAMRPDDLEERAEPLLRRLDVPTRIVWGRATASSAPSTPTRWPS